MGDLISRFILLSLLLLQLEAYASQATLSVLPGFAVRGQMLGVLRMNGRFLMGGDWISIGPYGEYESLAPQVVDTSYGAALRFGHESYVELQAGYFRRDFQQPGTPQKDGKGFSANVIYGIGLSPHFAVDIALAGKRIASGSLDKRWIIDLLPLIAIRGDF
ncbi:MAG: hypothetical protein AB7H97_09995 [Pseudobdellovibrionaceae bacterium]